MEITQAIVDACIAAVKKAIACSEGAYSLEPSSFLFCAPHERTSHHRLVRHF